MDQLIWTDILKFKLRTKGEEVDMEEVVDMEEEEEGEKKVLVRDPKAAQLCLLETSRGMRMSKVFKMPLAIVEKLFLFELQCIKIPENLKGLVTSNLQVKMPLIRRLRSRELILLVVKSV